MFRKGYSERYFLKLNEIIIHTLSSCYVHGLLSKGFMLLVFSIVGENWSVAHSTVNHFCIAMVIYTKKVTFAGIISVSFAIIIKITAMITFTDSIP